MSFGAAWVAFEFLDSTGAMKIFGERVRLLRNEKGWSQSELAEKIGGDARKFSRYENGHGTPSVEALVKIAEIFDVSIDYLVFEDAPRRPLKLDDQEFASKLQDLHLLSKQDRSSLLHIIEGLVSRHKFKALASQI